MTILTESKKTQNRLYADIYIKRKYPDGTFDSDWQDITRWFLGDGVGSIKYELDSGDFDVGLFIANNVNLSFDNSSGKFNDVGDSRSLWAGFETRNLTKFKIDAGYLDEDDAKVEGIPFEGYLDERSMKTDEKDKVTLTVLAKDAIFKTCEVAAGTLSSSVSASEAIYILCNRGEVTDHITVDQDNIDPSNDISLDDPGDYNGKKLDAALNDILLLSNSVLYVDSDSNLIVTSRNHSAKIKHEFYRNSSTGEKDNIYKISSINNGRQRVKNYWTWSGASLSSSSDSYLLKRYGVTKKVVSSSAVTNTTVQQSILDDLLDEFQYPKQEFVIETDYIPGVLTFFDTVTVEVNPRYTRETNLAIAGRAVAGTAQAVDFQTGLKIDKNKGFKVLSIEHNLREAKTILKLREKGTTLNDGYFYMIQSAYYSVEFSAATSVDVDVSGDGMDAQYCKVESLDSSDDYKTSGITVTRPDASTLRFTSSISITKTFRVLVVEVEH